jgi:hypothetical protein
VLGSVYFVVAVKRVRGMRLVGLARQDKRKAHAAPAVVARRDPATMRAPAMDGPAPERDFER